MTAKRSAAELRDEYRELRYSNLVAKERATKQLIESSFPGYGDKWGDFVDPSRRYGDSAGMGVTQAAFPDARKRGQPYVAYQTFEELRAIWSVSRYLSEQNPHIIGALGGLAAYVIHTGYTYRCVARPGVDADKAERFVTAAGQELDDFDDDSAWPELESETFRMSVVDGERMLRHFTDEDMLQVRVIEPEQCLSDNTDDGEWQYGVHVNPKDHQRVIGYGVTYSGDVRDAEEVPADEVEHFKRNVTRTTRRGLSDLFAVTDPAEDLRKLMRNMRQAAAVIAAVAWFEKNKTASRAEVESAHDTWKNFQINRQTEDGATRTDRYRRILPGAIIGTEADREFVSPPLVSNTPYFATIAQLARQTLCQRWNAPESFLGDASNGAYASLAVAESPFIRTCETEQQYYSRRFRRTKIRALKHAIARGRLSEDTLKYVDVQVTPTPLIVRNRLEQTQINKLRMEMGTLSPQDESQENGADWDQTKDEIAAAKKDGWAPPAAPGAVPVGASPGGAIVPGMMGEAATADPFAWLRE